MVKEIVAGFETALRNSPVDCFSGDRRLFQSKRRNKRKCFEKGKKKSRLLKPTKKNIALRYVL
ncbi:MAG: hypothetical protein MJ066_02085, partial [Clostridia bacterium]|nr:hypothetical protein [Clostridia bacterium]